MAGIQPFLPALCLLLLSSLLPPSTADTKTLILTSDDRPLLSLHKFSFSGPGRVTISASTFSVVSPKGFTPRDSYRLGLVLISREELMLWQSRGLRDRYGRRKCLLHSPYGRTLFTLAELSPPQHSGIKLSVPVHIPREYSLLFVNCIYSGPRVSVTVRAEFYNLGPGGSRNYLPKGQQEVIQVFAWFALAYFALLFMWTRLYNDGKRSVLWIHCLMFGLLLVKGFDLLRASVEKCLIRASGTLPPGFYLVSRTFYYYLFYFIEVLIVVGLWKSKSVLHPKLRIVTLITLAAQIIANMGLFCAGDERTRSIHELNKWNSVFVLTNIGFFLPVMASAWWSIKLLKEAEEANEKEATSKSSEMKKLLGIYVAGMGYLHFVYLFLFPFKRDANVSEGRSTAIEEAANLALCAIMLYLFRPEAKDGFEYANVDDMERQAEDEDDDEGTTTNQRAGSPEN